MSNLISVIIEPEELNEANALAEQTLALFQNRPSRGRQLDDQLANSSLRPLASFATPSS